MASLESILKECRELSADQRAEVVRTLLEQSTKDGTDDDADVGKRGLTAWTQSTRHEDWFNFYPDVLRNGRSTRP